MARVKRINFLIEFNGPKVYGPFRSDTILVFFITLISSYFAFTIASMPTSLIVVLSFLLTYVVVKLYIKAKGKAARGFLWHFLYCSGITSIKQDPKKFKEIERMDIKNYLPDSTKRIFRN